MDFKYPHTRLLVTLSPKGKFSKILSYFLAIYGSNWLSNDIN